MLSVTLPAANAIDPIKVIETDDPIQVSDAGNKFKNFGVFSTSLSIPPTEDEWKIDFLAREKVYEDILHDVRLYQNGINLATDAVTSSLAQLQHAVPAADTFESLDASTSYEEIMKSLARDIALLRNCGVEQTALINSMLEQSKKRSKTLELNPVVFDVNELIVDMINLYRLPAQKKGITFTEFKPMPKSWVKADRQRLSQILNNVLNNAVKFTEQGQVFVLPDLSDDVLTTEPRDLKLIIQDSGSGIAADKIPMLFTRFMQAQESGLPHGQGAGIGLAKCKGLAELMGGTITVKSEMGKGSTFTIVVQAHLPTQDEIEQAKIRQASMVDASTQQPALQFDIGPKHILVVDDSSVNRDLLGRMIMKLGLLCKTARSGEEALLLFDLNHTALILMDVMMPGLNGLETTIKIREMEAAAGKDKSQQVPIISTSAGSNQAEYEAITAVGMTDKLPKPFHAARVSDIFSRFLPVKAKATSESAKTYYPLSPSSVSGRMIV